MSVIWTKKAGLITLPELSDPGTVEDLRIGKQLIDDEGKVIEGALKEYKTCKVVVKFESSGTQTAWITACILENDIPTGIYKTMPSSGGTLTLENVICKSLMVVTYNRLSAGHGTLVGVKNILNLSGYRVFQLTAEEGETATLSGYVMMG